MSRYSLCPILGTVWTVTTALHLSSLTLHPVQFYRTFGVLIAAMLMHCAYKIATADAGPRMALGLSHVLIPLIWMAWVVMKTGVEMSSSYWVLLTLCALLGATISSLDSEVPEPEVASRLPG